MLLSPVSATGELHGSKSADDLLRLYAQIGIPHFQRGLVWETGAVAMLLESIFRGTPCGCIILWAPPDAAVHGISLGDSKEEPARILIVDGQQRIRSLQAVFGAADDGGSTSDEGDAESSDDSPDPDEAEGVWCLNLGRLPEFADRFPGGRRFRLFRQARDPRELARRGPSLTGALHDDQEALLPLRWFVENDEHTIQDAVCLDVNAPLKNAAIAVLENEAVNMRLRRMRTQPVFYVSMLDSSHSYRDVIATYNRINSAGKRVEAEERAFASLVASCAQAESELKLFFDRAWGGRRDGQAGGDLLRDDLLQRQKESQFGFKLFMRVFVMGLAYHSGRAVGSGSLSFDSADPDSLEDAAEHLQPILSSTTATLVCVETLLREKLFCDDLRMLPETASLWPVFQLLIRFPDLTTVGRATISSCAFRLMVADLDKRELLDLCRRVNEAPDASEAVAALDSTLARSHDIARAINRGVKAAKSLTNRFALMLYWLLRRRGAADFAYEKNLKPQHVVALRRRYRTSQEPILSESVAAQKQHIVPYRRLKEIYELSGSRPGRHEANDIGNLTYISAGENSFRTGVGENPLALGEEPPANLEAHLLDHSAVLSAFDRVCESTGDRSLDGARARPVYGRLCEIRRGRIAAELIEWDIELRSLAESEQRSTSEVLPAIRLVRKEAEDLIRVTGYAPPIAKKLAGLHRRRMRLNQKQDGELALAYTVDGAGKRQLLRIDLSADGSQIGLKLADQSLADAFVMRFPEVETHTRKRSRRCRLPSQDQAGVAKAIEVLDWVEKRLWPPGLAT